MFRARPLLWIRRSCSRHNELLTRSLTPPPTSLATLDQVVRTSSFLNHRVQRAASSQTTRYIIAQGLVKEKTFDFKLKGMTSQKSGPTKKFSSSAEEAEPWNCYHDEMVKLVENGGALIIDVRRADEIAATGIMKRACHIPLNELKEALDLPNDKLREKFGLDSEPSTDGSNVVFTCRSGRRSLLALAVAREFGYTKARHYPGGWNGWIVKSKL